jgi:hypothetical protein
MEWLSPEYAQYIMLLFLLNKRCCCFLNTEDYFMKGIKLLAATAAITVSSVAVAGPNYTYAQLGFFTEDSVGKEDTGGFELKGSFGFADLFHVGAAIDSGEKDGGKSKYSDDFEDLNLGAADTDSFEIYAGINPAITDNVDAIVRVGYGEGEYKGKTGGILLPTVDNKIERDFLFLQFGTRALITEKFELNAFATYSAGNIKQKQSGQSFFTGKQDFVQWSYEVGGIYNFTDMFAAGVALEIGKPSVGFLGDSRTDAGTIFARVNF